MESLPVAARQIPPPALPRTPAICWRRFYVLAARCLKSAYLVRFREFRFNRPDDLVQYHAGFVVPVGAGVLF
jgi:hypothetical protein